MDSFMHWFQALIPLTFLLGGVVVIITAFRGKPNGKKEHPMKAKLSEEEFRQFRKREIIIGCICGIGMSAFGGYLLYCWINGPIQR